MAKIRFSALEELAHRKPLEVPKRRRVSEIFGCDVPVSYTHLTLPTSNEV